jgi:hypothetical protein
MVFLLHRRSGTYFLYLQFITGGTDAVTKLLFIRGIYDRLANSISAPGAYIFDNHYVVKTFPEFEAK